MKSSLLLRKASPRKPVLKSTFSFLLASSFVFSTSFLYPPVNQAQAAAQVTLDLHTDAHNFKGLFRASLDFLAPLEVVQKANRGQYAKNHKSEPLINSTLLDYAAAGSTKRRQILDRLVYLFPKSIGVNSFASVSLDKGCPVCKIESKFSSLETANLYEAGKAWKGSSTSLASGQIKSGLSFPQLFTSMKAKLLANNAKSNADIPLFIIVPGIFGEFIKSSAFEEIFANGKGSNFYKLWNGKANIKIVKASKMAREQLKDRTSAKPKGKSLVGMDQMVKVASLDFEGKSHFRVAVLKTPEMSLESVGDNKSRAQMFNARIKRFLSLIAKIDGQSPKNVTLMGYSRGTGLALEMMAQAKASTDGLNYVNSKTLKAMASIGGVVSGSAVADEAINNTSSISAEQLVIVTHLLEALNTIADGRATDISPYTDDYHLPKSFASTFNKGFHVLPRNVQVAFANTFHFARAARKLIQLSLRTYQEKLANTNSQSIKAAIKIRKDKLIAFEKKIAKQVLHFTGTVIIPKIAKAIAKKAQEAIGKYIDISGFMHAVDKVKKNSADIAGTIHEATELPMADVFDTIPKNTNIKFIDHILTEAGAGEFMSELNLKTDVKSMLTNALGLGKAFGLEFLKFQRYDQDVLNFGTFVKAATTGIKELTASARMAWWRANDVPLGIHYYNISASFNAPIKGNQLVTNPWGYNAGSPDYKGLVGNYESYVKVKYNDTTSFDFGASGTVEVLGIKLNDSQVSVPRTMFWPGAIAALNADNKGIKSSFLGLLGTHHWGLALPIVSKNNAGTNNPFPRKALFYSTALMISNNFIK